MVNANRNLIHCQSLDQSYIVVPCDGDSWNRIWLIQFIISGINSLDHPDICSLVQTQAQFHWSLVWKLKPHIAHEAYGWASVHVGTCPQVGPNRGLSCVYLGHGMGFVLLSLSWQLHINPLLQISTKGTERLTIK